MQGNDDHYFKTHACAKHYAVHSGPEPLRHTYNASVSMRDLWETYLPAFKALVKKGNVREVMCAYNRYEGKPCCTSDRLLVDILRRKWGYNGIVLTDCDAINNFYNKGQHETHPDPLSASVDAVLNGTDLECGKVFMVLTEALEKDLSRSRFSMTICVRHSWDVLSWVCSTQPRNSLGQIIVLMSSVVRRTMPWQRKQLVSLWCCWRTMVYCLSPSR